MQRKSKNFKENSFVLYDHDDNLVCYFDDYNELNKYTNVTLRMLLFEFRKFGNIIPIVIDNKKMKLYLLKRDDVL